MMLGFLILIGMVALTLLGIMVYYLLTRGKKADPNAPEPNTMVLDPDKGRYLTYINWGDEKPGNPRRYEKGEYYLVKKPRYQVQEDYSEVSIESNISDPIREVGFYTIQIPPNIGILPEALFRALHDEISQILFELPASTWQKLGTTGMYLLIGGLAILLLCLK